MRNRLLFAFKSMIFWLVYFGVLRLMFLVYNHDQWQGMAITELLKTFLYGFKLDLSVTGYILMLYLLFLAIIPGNGLLSVIFKVFTLLLLTFFTLLSVVDMELFRFWGFRLDASILLYLQTPKESLASTPLSKIVMLTFIFVFLVWLFYKMFSRYCLIHLKAKGRAGRWSRIGFVPLAALMILPVRGGIGLAPINQGSVFFSEHQSVNYAALNVIWNFVDTLLRNDRHEKVQFMPDIKAEKIVEALLKQGDQPLEQLVIGEKPNILIIILESFTSGVVERLGGMPKATPNLNKWSRQGVWFSRFYASGDRSDKGLVAILSGYPAQPTTSIIKYVEKTARLPFLSKELKKHGYSSGFYYGGDIDFANMRSYLLAGGFDTLVTLKDFSGKDLNSKWGAHDHVVFQKMLNDLARTGEPFFRVLFTLSSHEPYDVPHKSIFNGSSEEQLFLNSVHYTDSCVGAFLEQAQRETWWDHTWVVLLADHGKSLPGNVPYNAPEKFKIPMLWLGGAINKDTAIHAVFSQHDVPLMILDQLGYESEFDFSKDVLTGAPHFAFYAYNNGFGFYNDTTGFVWDQVSEKIIYGKKVDSVVLEQGKAYFQRVLSDFSSK